MNSPSRRSSSHSAFSLVEVCLALGIASFTLLAIVGMLPVGLSTGRDAVANTVASGIATSTVAELRNIAPTNFDPNGPAMQTKFVRENGEWSNSWNTDTPYRVTVQFMNRPGAGSREAKLARILVTWPAAADRATASLPANYSGAFETVYALDIN